MLETCRCPSGLRTQAWLTERWRSKHGPGKEAEQLLRQLQALQSMRALGSQQGAALRDAVRVLVEHWEKVEKGSMSMGQVKRVSLLPSRLRRPGLTHQYDVPHGTPYTWWA